MKNKYKYIVVGNEYKDTSEIPKDRDLFYQCAICGIMIPSVPSESIGCKCGNIFIDKDMWRLVVMDYTNILVLRKVIDNEK